jgi:hypothetical protein
METDLAHSVILADAGIQSFAANRRRTWIPREFYSEPRRSADRTASQFTVAYAPQRSRDEKSTSFSFLSWLVNDLDHFLDSLPKDCLSKRPTSRPMAEYRGFDPDRNPFDISQDKGYEIDFDR